MRQLYATLRHRPAPLVGILVALTMTAMFITWAISLGEAAGSSLPAQRLANAAVVVTGNPTLTVASGSGPHAIDFTVPRSDYRRLPASLLTKLTTIPGVRDTVADQSVPVALELPDRQIVTGTSIAPLTGYGWQSAILTPFRLRSGHAPAGAGQIVLGVGVAAATGLSLGDQVSLAGRPRAVFTMAGIAAAPAGNPAGNWAVFFSAGQAAVLYGHPGQVRRTVMVELAVLGAIAGPAATFRATGWPRSRSRASSATSSFPPPPGRGPARSRSSRRPPRPSSSRSFPGSSPRAGPAASAPLWRSARRRPNAATRDRSGCWWGPPPLSSASTSPATR